MSFNRFFAENKINLGVSAGQFEHIPHDVALMILTYLSARDLARLLQVSRYFQAVTAKAVPLHKGEPLMMDPATNLPAKFAVVSPHLREQTALVKEHELLKYKLKHNRSYHNLFCAAIKVCMGKNSSDYNRMHALELGIDGTLKKA